MSSSDLSPKLLKALNDKNQKNIDECVKDKSVKKWIDNRVDRENGVDTTCLGYACRNNEARTVRQLVEAGADVNATDTEGYTPLHDACESKIEVKEKVKYLLSCNPSLIRARNNDNNTPLGRAAYNGHDKVIGILIQHGAEVNERGWHGRTALHDACSKGQVACIDELMRHGADVEATDSANKASPLQLAVDFNHPDSVKVLLDKYNASINATNKSGITALHRAVAKGNLEVVKLLTSYNQCDVNAKNNAGKTALDVARDKGHKDVVHYLAHACMLILRGDWVKNL